MKKLNMSTARAVILKGIDLIVEAVDGLAQVVCVCAAAPR